MKEEIYINIGLSGNSQGITEEREQLSCIILLLTEGKLTLSGTCLHVREVLLTFSF